MKNAILTIIMYLTGWNFGQSNLFKNAKTKNQFV